MSHALIRRPLFVASAIVSLAAACGDGTTESTLTVPDAPIVGAATAGNASATIAFTAPASNGGASIIEPGIAASIVAMALLNLRQPAATTIRSTRVRIAIVFGIGLLHGFGFSSAIGGMAIDTGSRLATLAGFNVGIEIGQFLFLSVIVLLVALGRRLVSSPTRLSLPQVASATAAMVGAAMLIERVAPFARSL